MSKYVATGTRRIIKTSKLYSDGKTQVPIEIISLLSLKHGDQIIWIETGGVIIIESSRQ